MPRCLDALLWRPVEIVSWSVSRGGFPVRMVAVELGYGEVATEGPLPGAGFARLVEFIEILAEHVVKKVARSDALQVLTIKKSPKVGFLCCEAVEEAPQEKQKGFKAFSDPPKVILRGKHLTNDFCVCFDVD
ncbi:hypothetical protein CYMTET_20467 [Cymbomonas tetramitiformis]|uniref:Uncharacterized protein n=1 Tax=Cymbomonas tetramitiformis TaxID=36881 RepID=A0AAE0L452_9CHLO|nr:hypothetical protein CYMTET_20467 [Cymbomonas tetramitiformis]